MEPTAARATKVVRIPSLLSAAEIAEIHRVAALVASEAASEHRGPNRAWRVQYLQSDNALERHLPARAAKWRAAAARVDRDAGWNLLAPSGGWNLRCAEYHRMGEGGGLSDPRHYDLGSLLTLDVLLEPPVAGGVFCTTEPDGAVARHEEFSRGDALVFVAHKPHHVLPVTRGFRQVLVCEYWEGVAAVCPHRCEKPAGCDVTAATARREDEAQLEDALFATFEPGLLEDAMRAMREEDEAPG